MRLVHKERSGNSSLRRGGHIILSVTGVHSNGMSHAWVWAKGKTEGVGTLGILSLDSDLHLT